MITATFLLGCCSSIRISVGFNYLVELQPKRYQTAVGTTWNMIDGSMTLVFVLYIWLVSKNWLYFFVF